MACHGCNGATRDAGLPPETEIYRSRMASEAPPVSAGQRAAQAVMQSGLRKPDYMRRLAEIARRIGAGHVAYGYGTREEVVLPFWGTLPAGFLDDYIDRDFRYIDSLSHRLAASPGSIVFDPDAFDDAASDIFLEVAGRHGIGSPGIGVPVIGVEGCTAGFMIYGLEIPDAGRDRDRLVRRVEREVEAFHGMVTKSAVGWGWLATPDFTAREVMCLYLSVNGMSGKEMVAAMSISPRSVDGALNSARRKLGASNHMEAAAIAVWKGLVKVEIEGAVLASVGVSGR